MIDYKYEFEHAVCELEQEAFDAADLNPGPRWHEQARRNVVRLRERLKAAEKVLELAAIESFKR